MFEPEDSATPDRGRPSDAGFYALILSKLIDEVRTLGNTVSPVFTTFFLPMFIFFAEFPTSVILKILAQDSILTIGQGVHPSL